MHADTWREVWDRLLAGNARFRAGASEHPRLDSTRLREIRDGQAPMATILTCSDSRVAPEHIFDKGLGDLFVIRVAGNVAGETVLASIEYAAAHLETPLIIVLGHSGCGAVTAALAGGKPQGHLNRIMGLLDPAVRAGDADVNQTARRNARLVAEQLRQAEPVLAPRAKDGILKILAAFYHLETGEVEILDEE